MLQVFRYTSFMFHANNHTRLSGVPRQKGMRVYGEPLIQFLTLDESAYFNTDWDYAARRVMSPSF